MSIELAIVLPAYNEEQCIAQVVDQWLSVAGRVGPARVIVVDDGSKDQTRGVLEDLARANPALLVIHQENSGHGAAILRGYRAALEQQTKWIFQTDSDGQTLPSDFEAFWKGRSSCPFQIGLRSSRHDPPVRILLSRWHERVVDRLFHVRLRDPNVPFRLMRADVLRRYLGLIPAGTFAPNVLLSVLAVREGALRSRPIAHASRLVGQTSVHGWRMLIMGLRAIREYLAFRRVVRRSIL